MKREEMYARLDALYDHIDATKAKAESARIESHEKLADELLEAKSRTEAAKENVRLSSERGKSKLSAEMLQLQMNVEKAREDRAAAKLEHDRRKAQKATEKLEDYAADAVSIALLAADEAAYATLDAIEARLSYEEVFGEDDGE